MNSPLPPIVVSEDIIPGLGLCVPGWARLYRNHKNRALVLLELIKAELTGQEPTKNYLFDRLNAHVQVRSPTTVQRALHHLELDKHVTHKYPSQINRSGAGAGSRKAAWRSRYIDIKEYHCDHR